MRQLAEIIEDRPLVHVGMSESVSDVARRMREKNVGAVAVLDDGRLVGIFSERDIVTRVVAENRDAAQTPIGVVMTKDLIVADPSDDIDDAVQKMLTGNCRHLPIVKGGNLLGMISIRDLLQIDDERNKAKASFLNELVTYSPDYDS
ncbi:MAG TPA: CBS domain-containing protein [Thermoanaerobaculia bacterium]|nr:CBS domain-containing protein [Thermoanaerobaculia bacterium]